jgi:hypothetical protein
MNELQWKHVFAIDRSRRYHLRRAGFHTGFDRLISFVLVILGSAVIASLDEYNLVIGIAVAVIGTAQIVYRFSEQARDHRDLAKRFSDLLADIKSVPAPTLENAQEWERRRLEIEHSEPPVFCGVEADVYNEVMLAYGISTPRRHIPRWAYCVMHFVRLESFSFEPKSTKPVLKVAA